ncbi:DUF1761 domain-containing protein [Shimia ponticola]|uniref:DUF1761 domain-containing protein n=1 Tax=Shimia ponticola TaxID=2582893 RepID=UPI0011BF2545|nr:DUF1761 domain-containing protein [Shimia ponticola]
MELVNIIAAAVASFAFGAVWYSVLGNKWMEVSGVEVVDGKPANQSDPMPYVMGLVVSVFMAGMMRHIFAGAGVEGVGRGALYGAGLGLFIASPWLITCYGFAGRPRALTLIDCGYAVFGSAVAGIVLTLF